VGQCAEVSTLDKVHGFKIGTHLKLLCESRRLSCRPDWASASLCAALRMAVCRGAAFWTNVRGSSESSSAHTRLMLFLRAIPETQHFPHKGIFEFIYRQLSTDWLQLLKAACKPTWQHTRRALYIRRATFESLYLAIGL
jgi:hypothetical protein